MMPLDDFQQDIYGDRAYLFRANPDDRDASGNLTGIRQVTTGTGIDCDGMLVGKLHSTHNFDTPIEGGGAGQKKTQNIDTSDKWKCDPDTDIRVGDFLQLLTTMPYQWRKVAGIANVRRTEFCNSCEFYLSLSAAPPVVLVS